MRALTVSPPFALLGSGAAGLSTGEVDRRQRACRSNRLERLRRRPLLGRILEQFGNFFAVNTAALSFAEWGMLLVLPPSRLLLEEGRKWIVRRVGPWERRR